MVVPLAKINMSQGYSVRDTPTGKTRRSETYTMGEAGLETAYSYHQR